jgi:hypothetical protein
MQNIITLCSTKNVHRKTLNGMSCAMSILIKCLTDQLVLAGSCPTLQIEKCRDASEKGIEKWLLGRGDENGNGERDEKGI